MKTPEKKTVLITGATAGIGKATAERFATAGNNLIITGRRQNRLKQLSEEWIKNYGVRVKTLCFDIQHRRQTFQALDSLSSEWQNIDILVNNAGLALGLTPFQSGNPDDWDQMIATNVNGLMYISQWVARKMIEQGSGHIVNIGSIAGRDTYPNGNVYCATKAAVDAFTKAMRMDLLPHGIRVTQIAPGAVETEFSIVRFKGDEQRAAKVYEGFQPLTPCDIAEAIWWVTSLPKHVNVNDMLIMPTAQAAAGLIQKN